jgi:glc operon protein GlcG
MTSSAKKITCTVCLALQALWTFPALAADPTVSIKVISEAGAQHALAAAEQEAEKLHAPCAIAVVDSSGTLVAFLKMDNVRAGSPDLAIGKARTSALLQRPSAETEDNIDKGRVAFVTAGLMTLRGGMPLLAGKEVVGAIGVASLNKDNDVAIAQAAAADFASFAASQPPSH